MMTQAHNHSKKFVTGTLLVATGVLSNVIFNAQLATAQTIIGGGGTCTPHRVTYQQYVPGYYNASGIWISSHYETRSAMSTECNNPGDQPIKPDTQNITGAWRTNNQNSNAINFISQNGSNGYILKNEFGSTSSAYVFGNHIAAPQWQVSGELENNNQVIVWSNGTAWRR